ncbi:MAG: YcgN family cysteine cluster protein, partial [Treponema sp.]|nr:YcgN family cysteine cluster protein [Treponema sp.]
MQEEFWKKKKLSELTDEEWEALCDGCGRCCYRKYLSGRGRKKKLFYTKVACDFLDLKTNRCTVYGKRFSESPDCEKLTKETLASCSWMPDSCAYRLLKE